MRTENLTKNEFSGELGLLLPLHHVKCIKTVEHWIVKLIIPRIIIHIVSLLLHAVLFN